MNMGRLDMLKNRIIPILTINGEMQVVKTVKFQRPARIVGNLMQYIKIFERRNLDELCILDIDATLKNRLINYEKIKEFTKELYCPLTLGGGIRTLDDINKLLQSGADKVCIGQSIWSIISSTKQQFFYKACEKFGSQAITASICYRDNKVCLTSKVSSSADTPLQFARHCENLGAGEILLTSIDRDGTYEGYDIDTTKSIASVCKIPVICNGGLSSVAHASKALKARASAVAGSSIFLFTEMTPRIMAEELTKLGNNMRLQ